MARNIEVRKAIRVSQAIPEIRKLRPLTLCWERNQAAGAPGGRWETLENSIRAALGRFDVSQDDARLSEQVVEDLDAELNPRLLRSRIGSRPHAGLPLRPALVLTATAHSGQRGISGGIAPTLWTVERYGRDLLPPGTLVNDRGQVRRIQICLRPRNGSRDHGLEGPDGQVALDKRSANVSPRGARQIHTQHRQRAHSGDCSGMRVEPNPCQSKYAWPTRS